MAVVYLHRRLDNNEVFYIGIGNNRKRAGNRSTRNNLWKKIVAKTDYKIDIVFEDISLKEAQEAEILLIKLYGRKNIGTGTLANLTDGGEKNDGIIRSEEWRKQHSEAMKGKTNSKESNIKRSLTEKGKINTKKVIDESTGVIYNSIGYAADAVGLKRTTLNAMLLGVNKNTTTLKYY